MKKTLITIEKVKTVCDIDESFVLNKFFTKESATFTEEEMSTLKNLISNLDEHGFLTVYDLVEYKEIYVDPKHYENATRMLYHNDRPQQKFKVEDLNKIDCGLLDGFIDVFFNKHWNFDFDGKFTWSDENCIDDLIHWLTEENQFSEVYVEYIPNVLDTFLSKEHAEGQMRAYEGYFPERMEIKENTISGSETKVLHKLISLLAL